MNIDNDNAPTPVENIEPVTSPEPSLDDFETEFFSGKAPEPKPVEETVDESDTTKDETIVETPEPVEQVEEEDDSETPKQETRAEKRIRELNAKYREEERKRLDLEQELAAERSSKEKPKNENTPTVDTDEDRAPHWDDDDANGNKLYPLGQFDPKFNQELVRFTVQQEQKQFELRQKQTEHQRRVQEAENALQDQWEEKLTVAKERHPDFLEKGQELVESFVDLEPAYGKYLTDTIRAIDNGTDVLYYLASNPDLAREIVNQGPAMATVALGRISAQFTDNEPVKSTSRTNVTKAPPPPPRAKGNASPRVKDLDDLDDFEAAFFRK